MPSSFPVPFLLTLFFEDGVTAQDAYAHVSQKLKTYCQNRLKGNWSFDTFQAPTIELQIAGKIVLTQVAARKPPGNKLLSFSTPCLTLFHSKCNHQEKSSLFGARKFWVTLLFEV